jgi:hypothetical protein
LLTAIARRLEVGALSELDEEQHIDAFEQHGVDMEAVATTSDAWAEQVDRSKVGKVGFDQSHTTWPIDCGRTRIGLSNSAVVRLATRGGLAVEAGERLTGLVTAGAGTKFPISYWQPA